MESTHYPLPEKTEADPLETQVIEQYGGEAKYTAALKSAELTRDDIREQLWWQLTTLRFIDYRFRPAVHVPDAAIASYYEGQVEKWKSQGQKDIPSLDQSRDSIERILTDERVDPRSIRGSPKRANSRTSATWRTRSNEPAPKVLWWSAGGALLLCLVVVATGIVVVRSAWFQEMVRDRIVSEVERATGGRTEIGSFRFNWHTMTAEVAPFVLHGTEPSTAPPLFRADSIRVGLKIISMIERSVDIQSLIVEKPELTIVVPCRWLQQCPPSAHPAAFRAFVEQVLKLAIRRVAFNNGFIDYNSQRFPLELRGEHLSTRLLYDSKGPRYRGEISLSPVHVTAGAARDLTFDLDASFAMDKYGMHVAEGRLRMPHSSVTVTGAMLDWATPEVELAVRANIAVADVRRPLGIGFSSRGDLGFDGRLYLGSSGLRLTGRASGRGVDFRVPALRLEATSFSAHADITNSRVDLNGLALSALGGTIQGHLIVDNGKNFRLDGSIRNISIRRLAEAQTFRPPPWRMSGPLRASGALVGNGPRDVLAEASMEITPRPAARACPAISKWVTIGARARCSSAIEFVTEKAR